MEFEMCTLGHLKGQLDKGTAAIAFVKNHAWKNFDMQTTD